MRFWYEPVSPLNLGLCRVLFFGAFFLFYLPQDFSVWAGVSHSFWMPIDLFRILHLSVFPAGTLAAMQTIWKISLALSCVGLLTRASTVSSFLLGTYLLGLPHNFGKIHHFDALVVIVLGIMAVSRCGDACSIDRMFGRRRHRRNPSGERLQASGEYTWPVRAVWLMFALIFFAAGASKLRHSGLEWIFSDNMAIILIGASYHLNSADPLVSWGPDLARYAWLSRMLAAVAMVLELSYPLALFSRRARWIIVPGVFLMQVGIRVLLGPPFYQFLICNLFWVPWDRVGAALAHGIRESSSPRGHSTAHKGARPEPDGANRQRQRLLAAQEDEP
jgi:hypothetical protein